MNANDFMFASQLFSYPDEGTGARCAALLEDGVQAPPALLEAVTQTWAQPERVAALGSEYIDLFDRGREQNSPYETEYGRDRPLRKGAELADLAGFYRAFGLDPSQGAELIDHVAVECEFYAVLELKAEALAARGDLEGVEIVRDAQKKFLESHLGRFVGAFAQRPGVVRSGFYSAATQWLSALVDEACRQRRAAPDPVSYVAQKPDGEMNCGALTPLRADPVQTGSA